METVVNFRIKEGLAKKLAGICARMERPKSFVIRKALEIYVDEYADYQIALDRLNDKDDPILGSKAVDKLLK